MLVLLCRHGNALMLSKPISSGCSREFLPFFCTDAYAPHALRGTVNCTIYSIYRMVCFKVVEDIFRKKRQKTISTVNV